mgnify:FL=1
MNICVNIAHTSQATENIKTHFNDNLESLVGKAALAVGLNCWRSKLLRLGKFGQKIVMVEQWTLCDPRYWLFIR